MTGRLRILENRQQELKTQCNRERSDLEEHINALAKPLDWINKGISAIHIFKNYPLLLSGVFVALTTYKPKLAGRVLAVVGIVKLLKSSLH